MSGLELVVLSGDCWLMLMRTRNGEMEDDIDASYIDLHEQPSSKYCGQHELPVWNIICDGCRSDCSHVSHHPKHSNG